MLTDDILLSILERVDITTCVRTSVLTKRWKHLPWLLRELNIDVKRFLSVPSPNPIEVEQMDEAMASLTKAITSFLATSRSEATIKRLQLRLYLVNDYSDAIGPHYYRICFCSRPFVPVTFGPGTIGGFCPGSNG